MYVNMHTQNTHIFVLKSSPQKHSSFQLSSFERLISNNISLHQKKN
uniref:Uncharacterized protein n=1 Tax=Anguilla anguilla TaxID=7936 RepID=A0A0E9XTP4_ANGAN